MAAVEKRKGGYPRGKPRTKPSTGKGQRAGVTLTKKLGAAICGHVATGTPKRFAALAEGVSENTLAEWVRRGEGNDERSATELTRWFAREMRKAEAKDVNRRKVRLEAHAEADPKVDMWWLERRHPEEFGRADRLEVSGDAAKPIRVELAFDPSGLVAAVEARRRIAAPRAIDVEAEEIS